MHSLIQNEKGYKTTKGPYTRTVKIKTVKNNVFLPSEKEFKIQSRLEMSGRKLERVKKNNR